ncbi:hypothetical protein [Cohnella herbarum]|uniref:Uncharacterized protein n=1 Tax=Cohnella herbarum TaxID=2728023 RepID=A0A7Z2ZL54_9BACL|nr:hypothetical protein [Cohnella herbarum]QJD83525.1 hypothetical protein HH215_10240 [Cohnella herbarum]
MGYTMLSGDRPRRCHLLWLAVRRERANALLETRRHAYDSEQETVDASDRTPFEVPVLLMDEVSKPRY